MKKYTGIYPALVTPYDSEGRIHTEALQKLTEKLLDKGASGFYVGGSTAESFLLSTEERKMALDAVLEISRGRAEVIANVGLFSTEYGVSLARYAAERGASAISSVPPFYFPFTMDEYLQYYNDLAAATDLPVIIYNIPAMSGISFGLTDIERLFKNEKIAGMKHTSYDLFQLERVLERYPEKSVFCGHDELFLPASSVGVKAGIGSTYNIMAEKFVHLLKMAEEGRMEEAKQLQGEINKIVEALMKVGIFKGIKSILRMQGIDCGTCRKPFLPLTKEQEMELEETALSCGLL